MTTGTDTEDAGHAPGPGAYRVEADIGAPEGDSIVRHAVAHIDGPSAFVVVEMHDDRAEVERRAALLDRLLGRALLVEVDSRVAGLPSREAANRYLDSLNLAGTWGPGDAHALYAHVLWEYEADDGYDSGTGDLVMDDGDGRVPTLQQVADWLGRGPVDGIVSHPQ
jgi:hypothetical protein